MVAVDFVVEVEVEMVVTVVEQQIYICSRGSASNESDSLKS